MGKYLVLQNCNLKQSFIGKYDNLTDAKIGIVNAIFNEFPVPDILSEGGELTYSQFAQKYTSLSMQNIASKFEIIKIGESELFSADFSDEEKIAFKKMMDERKECYLKLEEQRRKHREKLYEELKEELGK